MPQKRNPVALEHARAIGSKALGQAQAIVPAVHNTPFGDIVDTEDDLQPLVFSMFRDATRAVKLVAAAMQTAEFDAAALEARAGDGGTTLTELADTLVREHGLPFRTAHAIAGARAEGARAAIRTRRLTRDARRGVLRAARPADSCTREERLHEILSPRHFVEVRTHARRAGARGDRARRDGVGRQLGADEREWPTRPTALQARAALRARAPRCEPARSASSCEPTRTRRRADRRRLERRRRRDPATP